MSNPLSGASNSLVNVTINLVLSTVFCNFLNQQDSTAKLCTIEYGPSRSCDELFYKESNTSNTSTAAIHLRTQFGLHKEIMHCFVVTASSKTFMLKIMGKFYTGSYS